MNVARKIGFWLLYIMVSVFLIIAIFPICLFIPSMLKPEETIFWVIGEKFRFLFLIEALVIWFVPLMIQGFRKNEKERSCPVMKGILKRFWWLALCVMMMFVYMIVTDTTYITENQIIHKSFANPVGSVYMYDDVAAINTGFHGKKRFFEASKGDFYYTIILNDGIKIELNQTGEVCEDKISNYITYKEIHQFDQKIMRLQVTKISSFDYLEFNRLDQIYQDIFSKVIQNK